jgi:hypothetical protein
MPKKLYIIPQHLYDICTFLLLLFLQIIITTRCPMQRYIIKILVFLQMINWSILTIITGLTYLKMPEIRKNSVYFDGSNTTNRILDVLEEGRPNIICIDELDEMPRTFQNQLLNFMESGRIKVDQQRRQYDFQTKVCLN